jgi:hypothetical protein
MSGGQLLMISDLEGCAEKSRSGIKQTTILCQDDTFTAIKKFLKNNTKNKVAFLGDYFDNGPHVVNSINNIVELHTEYNDRVHIILGNRDVNKLRLIYEVGDKIKEGVGENGFWDKIIIGTIVKETDIINKMKLIFANTMGAPNGLEINTIAADNKLIPPNSIAYFPYILMRIFNNSVAKSICDANNEDIFGKNSVQCNSVEDESEIQGDDYDFIANCRKLFEIAKIVHYDPDFKVLLSHAGGFTNGNSSFILNNTAYYDNIIKQLGEITAMKGFYCKYLNYI